MEESAASTIIFINGTCLARPKLLGSASNEARPEMIERVETTNTQAKKEGRGVREEKDDQGAGGSNQRIGSPKERQMKICGRERTEEANKQKNGVQRKTSSPRAKK